MTNERSETDTARTAGTAALEDREWDHVLWELTERGVLALTINRPEQLNALTFPLLRELLALVNYAASDPAVPTLTIRGAGTRAFSSGDDLRGMHAEVGVDNAHSVHHQLAVAMRELPKPVVALMYGYALGAGFELALACDFRLAAEGIEIGDHRATRAINPVSGASWFLPRMTGHTRALELLMTGRHLNAQEALDWGIVNRVWPSEQFEQSAAEYVTMLAALPTVTVGIYKEALEYAAMHGLRDSLANEVSLGARNRATTDAQEGRQSFMERRDPQFKGR